jgi:hypothetical protein
MHHLITTQFSSATLSRVWKPPGYEPHSRTLPRQQQRKRRRRRRRSCSGRTSTLSKSKMADRGIDDRAVRPLPVFNGTMNGPSKMCNDGDSYAVWRARLVINLRAKRLLSIVTGNDDYNDSDDDEIQSSPASSGACRAHHDIHPRYRSVPVLSRRQQRSCGHTSHPQHKVPRHRHVVCHVGRQRVHHQEVPFWSARGDVCRRVRRTCHASGGDWSRSLGTDARCQLSQLSV